jgi:hypothetical protein
MTLAEWADRASCQLTGYSDSPAVSVPDIETGSNRADLWHLSDYRVTSVVAGTIWLSPSLADPLVRTCHTWDVVVGNIGTTYSGPNEKQARNTYREYVLQSERGVGRASGEDVTLMRDGEIAQEHYGAPTVYVVRDASGEYIRENGKRTPASNEAKEFETREEAKAACERSTDKVLSREVE